MLLPGSNKGQILWNSFSTHLQVSCLVLCGLFCSVVHLGSPLKPVARPQMLAGERQIYGFHQLLPGELPDRQEGPGDTLVQVLFAHLPGSDSGFQVLMANDLIVLTAF